MLSSRYVGPDGLCFQKAEELTLRFDDVQIAFKFFDLDGDGHVSFEEFKRVFSENLGPDAIPFDVSLWIRIL